MPQLMANRVKLFDILDDIRKAFPGYADLLGSEFDDDTILIRKAGPAETVEVQATEHIIIGRISTIAVDTYQEVVLPEGMDISHYEKNRVVLWGHNYLDFLPHAENAWLTPYPRKKPHEIRAATKYYTDQERGREIYSHREQKRPLGYSIGYIPIKDITPNDDNWKETLEEWQDRYSEYKGGNISKRSIPSPRLITAKWILLEYSDVVVPANPDAVQIYVEKGFIKPEQIPDYTIVSEDTKEKTVIPYKDLGKTDEGAEWDGPKEVAAADVDDLKLMCTWYDSDNADVKSAYKLPHHKASGHAAVWRGVAAAMAALLGARGGVDIPDSDRKSVYSHLAKHYPAWDKEPPEFRGYSEGELRIINTLIDKTNDVESFYDKSIDLTLLLASWCDTIRILQIDDNPDDFDLEKIVAEIDDEIDLDPEEIKDVVREAIQDIFKNPDDYHLDDSAKQLLERAKYILDSEKDMEIKELKVRRVIDEILNPSGKSLKDIITAPFDDTDFALDELPTPEELVQLAKGKVL